MSVSRLTGVQLLVFLCSSISVMLFDNPRINTLFLLSSFCFNTGFICNLLVAHNDSRTEQIYGFTTIEAESEGWIP